MVVGAVVAQPVVAGVVAGRGCRCCFGRGGVGARRGGPVQRPVRPEVVVDATEAVELGLQVGQGGRGGLSCQPALLGLVEALDFSLGLRMVGMAVLLGDAQAGEQVLKAVSAAGEAGSVDRAIVGELDWGSR